MLLLPWMDTNSTVHIYSRRPDSVLQRSFEDETQRMCSQEVQVNSHLLAFVHDVDIFDNHRFSHLNSIDAEINKAKSWVLYSLFLRQWPSKDFGTFIDHFGAFTKKGITKEMYQALAMSFFGIANYEPDAQLWWLDPMGNSTDPTSGYNYNYNSASTSSYGDGNYNTSNYNGTETTTGSTGKKILNTLNYYVFT